MVVFALDVDMFDRREGLTFRFRKPLLCAIFPTTVSLW